MLSAYCQEIIRWNLFGLYPDCVAGGSLTVTLQRGVLMYYAITISFTLPLNLFAIKLSVMRRVQLHQLRTSSHYFDLF